MTQDQPNRLDRLEATVSSHNDILNQIAAAHRQLTEFSIQQAQRTEERLTTTERLAQQNSEAIAQLVTATFRNTTAIARHDETLTRIEANLDRLELQMEQLREIVTTSTTETIQLVAQQAVQSERDRQAWQEDRQTWQAEIRRIWEHLERQTGNGNGRGEG